MVKKLALTVVGSIAALLAVFFIASEHESTIALSFAEASISSLQTSQEERKKYEIPEVVSSGSFRLVDTDLFERTWIFWFDGGEKGLMEIRVYAPNGLSFVPLFNSHEELKIVSVDYLSSGRPGRDTNRSPDQGMAADSP